MESNDVYTPSQKLDPTRIELFFSVDDLDGYSFLSDLLFFRRPEKYVLAYEIYLCLPDNRVYFL